MHAAMWIRQTRHHTSHIKETSVWHEDWNLRLKNHSAEVWMCQKFIICAVSNENVLLNAKKFNNYMMSPSYTNKLPFLTNKLHIRSTQLIKENIHF
jgi:hypothetical protein